MLLCCGVHEGGGSVRFRYRQGKVRCEGNGTNYRTGERKRTVDLRASYKNAKRTIIFNIPVAWSGMTSIPGLLIMVLNYFLFR